MSSAVSTLSAPTTAPTLTTMGVTPVRSRRAPLDEAIHELGQAPLARPQGSARPGVIELASDAAQGAERFEAARHRLRGVPHELEPEDIVGTYSQGHEARADMGVGPATAPPLLAPPAARITPGLLLGDLTLLGPDRRHLLGEAIEDGLVLHRVEGLAQDRRALDTELGAQGAQEVDDVEQGLALEQDERTLVGAPVDDVAAHAPQLDDLPALDLPGQAPRHGKIQAESAALPLGDQEQGTVSEQHLHGATARLLLLAIREPALFMQGRDVGDPVRLNRRAAAGKEPRRTYELPADEERGLVPTQEGARVDEHVVFGQGLEASPALGATTEVFGQAGGDRANDVLLGAATLYLTAELTHDVRELPDDVLDLGEHAQVQVVPRAVALAIPARLEGVVHADVADEVAHGIGEACVGLARLLLLPEGPYEGLASGEEGCVDEHLSHDGRIAIHRLDDDAGLARVQGKGHHAPADLRQAPVLCDGAQQLQAAQGARQVPRRRRGHEVEGLHGLDPQVDHAQHDVREIRASDLLGRKLAAPLHVFT